MPYHFKIIKNLDELPFNWDLQVAHSNIFLSVRYFHVLKSSKPENMECFAVAYFKNDVLIGGALFQHLDFSKHETFQRKNSWCSFKNVLSKKFSKDVLIVGNNMLTGQNGFYFNLNEITPNEITVLLENSVQEFQKSIKKTSLIIYKDYQKSTILHFQGEKHLKYFQFSVQPNMVLEIRENWNSNEDYIAAFSKKYRDRTKSARRKFSGFEKRELDLSEVKKWESSINKLYHNVAENAPFNTFFLAENHFSSLKENLGENFKIFGYFKEQEIVGFYTFICNKNDLDTYFLGYNKEFQKPNQLYLNMLLDMVACGIDQNFDKIIFGRTALEIKSTIGAEPLPIFGMIKHNNFFINKMMPKIFPYLEPKVEWLQRKPFK
jgi:hypothetical protein